MLTSSVKPHQLMAGKILGIGSVGLSQILVRPIFIGLFSVYGMTMVSAFGSGEMSPNLPSIPITTIIFFIVFFILGFFLYATLYAALGAMVEQESDAQSMQWPVMMFLIFGFMLMFYILPNPDTPMAVGLSIFPLFAPLLMFLRISIQAASPIEITASIVVLLLTIWGAIWVVGKIYRVGILMYGKRPTLPEILKWIKY